MSEIPRDLRYAESHEWIRVDGDEATVGITDHAQRALNDIVFVELPEAGATIEQGEQFGVVESVKSVSELYLPVAGTVIEANTGLEDTPERINEDPYGDGWLIRIRVQDPSHLQQLLDAAAYKATLD